MARAASTPSPSGTLGSRYGTGRVRPVRQRGQANIRIPPILPVRVVVVRQHRHERQRRSAESFRPPTRASSEKSSASTSSRLPTGQSNSAANARCIFCRYVAAPVAGRRRSSVLTRRQSASSPASRIDVRFASASARRCRFRHPDRQAQRPSHHCPSQLGTRFVDAAELRQRLIRHRGVAKSFPTPQRVPRPPTPPADHEPPSHPPAWSRDCPGRHRNPSVAPRLATPRQSETGPPRSPTWPHLPMARPSTITRSTRAGSAPSTSQPKQASVRRYRPAPDPPRSPASSRHVAPRSVFESDHWSTRASTRLTKSTTPPRTLPPKTTSRRPPI